MPFDYATGEYYDDNVGSATVPLQANDWYDQYLRDIGIDPSTATGTGSTSPSNEEIMKQIGVSGSPLSFISSLLKGTSSLGTAGQLAGLAGIGGLLNSMFGSQGGGYAGYKGGIPAYTASRQMLPIPQTVTTATGETVPRRPGSGGVTYFSPMTYTAVPAPTAAPEVTPEPVKVATGGIMGLAPRYNLGGYSDGGRLLRGPGDGVSDSIPATIGDRQPARLADGEFVVPARIVSELGNGSTEAGARKLYAMMDRVKTARKKTTKNIAADTKADKYLPA